MQRRWVACAVLAIALVRQVPAQKPDGEPAAGFHGEFASFDMVDADTGWAIGRAGDTASLLQTHDGGKTWTDISPQPVRSKAITVLSDAEERLFCHLLDATHGWASVKQDGGGRAGWNEVLFSTEDGGRTWKRNSFETSVGSISSIQFPDSSHGFILVESDPALGHTQKAAYRTTDGGKTWWTTSESSHEIETDQCLPGTGFSEGMVFRNADDGWVNGSPRGDDEAFFFRTRDGGDHWRSQSFKVPSGFSGGYERIAIPQFFGDRKEEGVLGVHFIQHDPERSAYAIYHTHDGGEDWLRVGFAPDEASDAPSFVDERRGWLMADEQLFATADGGAKWQKLGTNLRFGSKESVSQFYFVSTNVGWLSKDIEGDDNRYELLRTTDGGHTWTHCCGPRGELAPPQSPEATPGPVTP